MAPQPLIGKAAPKDVAPAPTPEPAISPKADAAPAEPPAAAPAAAAPATTDEPGCLALLLPWNWFK